MLLLVNGFVSECDPWAIVIVEERAYNIELSESMLKVVILNY